MSKFFLKSKTVQGVLAMLVPMLLQLFGIEIADAEITEIVEALTVLSGAVWALYGRLAAEGGLHFLRPRVPGFVCGELASFVGLVLIAALIGGALGLSGCATWETATPPEKARIMSVELSEKYVKLHKEYEATLLRMGPEGRAVMETKVAPILDRLKQALILFNNGSITWSRTNEKPEDMEGLDRDVRRFLADAGAALAEVSIYYLNKGE